MSSSTRQEAGSPAMGCSGIAAAPLTLLIIAANCILFYVNNVMRNPSGDGTFPEVALATFTFSPGQGHVYPGILTHMFSHADIGHLLGNMFMLLFLGASVERAYGQLRYAALYLLAGLAAAGAQALVSPDVVMLGASGAIAGVMAAFARHWPNQMLYFAGRIPMPAWLYMLVWVGYNLFGAGSGQQGIAFMAHLGGFAAGLLFSFLVAPKRAALTS